MSLLKHEGSGINKLFVKSARIYATPRKTKEPMTQQLPRRQPHQLRQPQLRRPITRHQRRQRPITPHQRRQRPPSQQRRRRRGRIPLAGALLATAARSGGADAVGRVVGRRTITSYLSILISLVVYCGKFHTQ